MRISDWSSDVCSSDLDRQAGSDRALINRPGDQHLRLYRPWLRRSTSSMISLSAPCSLVGVVRREGIAPSSNICSSAARPRATRLLIVPTATSQISAASRSEEHTSELQSLMRTSYAVFCLKKKKNNRQATSH